MWKGFTHLKTLPDIDVQGVQTYANAGTAPSACQICIVSWILEPGVHLPFRILLSWVLTASGVREEQQPLPELHCSSQAARPWLGGTKHPSQSSPSGEAMGLVIVL